MKKPTMAPAKTPEAAAPTKAKPAGIKTVDAGKRTARQLTEGQQAYEAKRAAKAGMSVDRWLASKQRAQNLEAREKAKAAEPAKPAKPPGLLSRLLDRAHKPLR